MRKKLLVVLSLVIVLAVCVGVAPMLTQGQTAYAAYNTSASTYYSGITEKSGRALLGQLHDLITTTHSYYTSYNECRAVNYSNTDPGSNSNYLMEFYTQEDIKADSFDVSGGWNREHVWPKADSNGIWKDVGNSDRGGGADLHHIRPAEKDLNNARGNLKFGEVTNGTPRKASGTDVVGGYSNSNTFEPIDEVKGDVARIIFYVYTHYNTYSNVGGTTNGSGSYFGTLNFTHIVTASNEDAAIKLLLKWNENDPIDDIERTRNEEVAKVQGNRNPFIDNAKYANAIWGGGTTDENDLKSISISPSTASVAVGATTTLTVVKNPTNATANVTWTSSDPSVASVSNGVVTGVSAGTATITANPNKAGVASATATITVTSNSTTPPTPSQSGEFTITRSSFSANSGNYGFYAWSSGTVQGIAFIHANETTNMQLNNSKASYYIASTAPTPGGITEIKIETTESKSWTLLTSKEKYGEAKPYPDEGTPHDKKTGTVCSWTLDGTDTYFSLNYSDSGVVYVKSITVKYGGGGGTVTPEPNYSLTLNKTSLSLAVGGSETLVATPNGGLTGTLSWTSSNPNVATVANGVVTAVSAGTATITAKIGDYSATCQVTVSESTVEPPIDDDPPQSGTFTISRSSFSIETGQYAFYPWSAGGIQGVAFIFASKTTQLQFNNDKAHYYLASTTPVSGVLTEITIETVNGKAWELLTSNTAYGEEPAGTAVPTEGTPQGTSTGKIYTWTLDGTHKYFTLNYKGSGAEYIISITVKYAAAGTVTPPNPQDSVTLDKSEITLDEIGATAKINTIEPTSGIPVWTTSDASVATVSQDGTVTAVGNGTATITATCGTATAICTVTVTAEVPDPDSVTLDKSSATIEVGKTVTIVATANGDVVWTTSNPNVATVTGGVVTGVSAGTVTITATCGTATATCEVTVTAIQAPADSVTLNKTEIALEVGENTSLIPSATGTVTWSSSNTSVATVSANGVVTAVSAGTTTITATCGTATATCTVTVTGQSKNVLEFISAVEAIGSDATVKTFDAIARALALYGNLSAVDKQAVSEIYTELLDKIDAYNAAIDEINNAMTSTLNASWAGVLAMAFAAAVVFVLKQSLR